MLKKISEGVMMLAGALVGATIHFVFPDVRGTAIWSSLVILMVNVLLMLPLIRATRRLMETLPVEERNTSGLLQAASKENLGVRFAAAAVAAITSITLLMTGLGAATALLHVASRHLR
jgi:hypothetical protein